jgi:hypothetical protein
MKDYILDHSSKSKEYQEQDDATSAIIKKLSNFWTSGGNFFDAISIIDSIDGRLEKFPSSGQHHLKKRVSLKKGPNGQLRGPAQHEISESYLSELAHALKSRPQKSKTRIILVQHRGGLYPEVLQLLGDAYCIGIVSKLFRDHCAAVAGEDYTPPLPSEHQFFHIECEKASTHISAVFYKEVATYEDTPAGAANEQKNCITTSESVARSKSSCPTKIVSI